MPSFPSLGLDDSIHKFISRDATYLPGLAHSWGTAGVKKIGRDTFPVLECSSTVKTPTKTKQEHAEYKRCSGKREKLHKRQQSEEVR